jgi:hypothetical protein
LSQVVDDDSLGHLLVGEEVKPPLIAPSHCCRRPLTMARVLIGGLDRPVDVALGGVGAEHAGPDGCVEVAAKGWVRPLGASDRVADAAGDGFAARSMRSQLEPVIAALAGR